MRDRRLAHLNWLETALECGVLLDVLAIFVQGRRADGLQFTARQFGFEDRRGVDRTLGGARTHQGMQLIDEQNDVAAGVDLLEHLLEAFLEVTAVPAAGHERTQVKGVELLVLEGLGDLTVDDGLSQAFNHRCLAHSGLTDQYRVVLGAPTQDLHDPLDFLLTTDDRVELALHGGGGEVAAELVEDQ